MELINKVIGIIVALVLLAIIYSWLFNHVNPWLAIILYVVSCYVLVRLLKYLIKKS